MSFSSDAVLVVEPAAHVDRGGVRPFGRADRLALEVGRRFDLAVLVDVEGREAEQPRADHRQADDVGRPRVTWAQNFANDSSLTSHSRLKVKRAKIS